MKLKRILAFLMTLSLLITCSFVGTLGVEAAYDYLFPVNNGGVIGYVYGYSASYGSFHKGVDLHARTGDYTIYAAYSGVVGGTANSCYHVSYGAACEHYNTFGNYIRIDQDDGNFAYYGHLKQNTLLVKVGDRVVKGQPIATMGSSGYSTGTHLHFEVRSSKSDTSSTINVNSKELGGVINYSYTGYGATAEYDYATIQDGVYYFKNGNGKYMAVEGGIEADGQNVNASDFAVSDALQFEITKDDVGYEFRPLCAENSVVNNYGYSVSDGNNITLWEITDHASQKWNFESVEGGYVLRSAMNPSCCLAVDSQNNVYVASYTGAENQIWTLENAISFNGEDSPETEMLNYGDKFILPDFARDGYAFLGWADKADAEFASYPAGATYAGGENLDLYPILKQVQGDNLAFEKSYTVSGSGVGFGDYQANLTDGNHYANASYDTNWFALYYSKDANEDVINSPNGVGEIIIDLGDVYSVNAINANLINISQASVATPTSVKAYISVDGTSYSSVGDMPITNSEPYAYWSFLEANGNARYVKLEFALSDVFAFVNEIEVYGGAAVEDDIVLGDVNADGAIDQYDYILVKRHYFETRLLTDEEFVRGDVNKDGKVDQYDYILIARHYFGTYVIG